MLKNCEAAFTSFGDYVVRRRETSTGYKYFFDDQWLTICASARNPVLRCYAESSTAEGARFILAACRAPSGPERSGVLRCMCRSAPPAVMGLRLLLARCMDRVQHLCTQNAQAKTAPEWRPPGSAGHGRLRHRLLDADQAWYAGYTRTAFHTFNDGDEWFQMDKVGHTFSAYAAGRGGPRGLPVGRVPRSALHVGGRQRGPDLPHRHRIPRRPLLAMGLQRLGHESEHTGGEAFSSRQQLAWKEQRISVKYSAHTTKY